MGKSFYTNVAVLGDNILYCGFEDGKRVRRKVPYSPTLYLKTKGNTPSPFKTLYGDNVSEYKPGSIRETKDFVERYKDTDGMTVFGLPKYDLTYISDLFMNIVDWDINLLNIGNIDIEVGPAPTGGFATVEDPTGEVTAITYKLNNIYYVFSTKPYTPKSNDVQYTQCRNEQELLMKFLDVWSRDYPDIVTGWNVKFFDFPYLINRVAKIFGEEKSKLFSPWKKINERSAFIMGKDQVAYEMVGITIYDYMELFRKFAPNGVAQESYRLDHIAHGEIGERKLTYDEVDSLFALYETNFEKFIDYNIRDCMLVDKIDKKLRLIELAITAAYESRVNFGDVFYQTRMWTSIIYNHLRKKNIVINYKNGGDKDQKYEGAYVKEPQIGVHDWVASFDLKSLYPSLIIQYNISPETFKGMYDKGTLSLTDLIAKKTDLQFLKDQNITICPNGAMFDRSVEGFLPEIIQGLMDTRDAAKAQMLKYESEKETCQNAPRKAELVDLISRYNNIQSSRKIALNSAYGAIGAASFFLFDVRLAEAITLGGQLSINWIQDRVNAYMNKLLKSAAKDYVIASDTDSIYLSMAGIVEKIIKDQTDTTRVIKFMDELCKKEIRPYIDKEYADLYDYMNAFKNTMIMKREVLCDKAIWVAGKHYILNVHNSEGVQYAEPKLKVKGLEAIKSSTPAACRVKLKDAMKIIIGGGQDAIIDAIDKFKLEFRTLPLEDIASPTGVNGIKAYADKTSIYIKGTPMHVKAALVYNNQIKKLGLEKKYPLIQDGDKIKYVAMKEPNPFQSPVLGFPMRLPPEFESGEYINYKVQFEKSYLGPLKSILDKIGWETEHKNTLF